MVAALIKKHLRPVDIAQKFQLEPRGHLSSHLRDKDRLPFTSMPVANHLNNTISQIKEYNSFFLKKKRQEKFRNVYFY
jgi:hypothetical protein